MSSDQKKKISQRPSKLYRFPFWLPLVVSFVYGYSKFFIGAMMAGLVILIFKGYSFTIWSLLLLLSIIGYILLSKLNKWFETHS